MSWWYGLFEISSEFIEAWLCYKFVGIFLPERVRGRLPFFLLSLTLVSSVRGMDFFELDPLISTLWFVFFICMTTVILFQVELFYAVSLVSFYFLCLYIIKFFCISVMGVMAGNQQFAQFVLNQLSLWRLAYMAADKTILFLLYFSARRAFKDTPFYHPRMMFTVSMFGILGVGFLSLFTLKEISVLTLFSWGLFLVILLCFCLIMIIYANYTKEKNMRNLLEIKDQLVSQEYEAIRQIQKEQEILSHNMKNHLLVLHGMMKEGQLDHACAYITQLRSPVENLSPSIWTGTPTLDVLLNHTKNRCIQAHIQFTVQADAIEFSSMKEQDLCSLFANLLDNAWEASRRMPEGGRWILFKIRKIKDMIFIEISNSAQTAPKYQNGKLVSLKENGTIHGIGVSSAASSAYKYGGQLEHEYRNHIFMVKISFLGGICPL